MKKYALAAVAFLVNLVVLAQEKKAEIDVDVNKNDGGNWYAAPWVWVVGGAVFILLLVALLRGNRRSNVD
jgi:hypothetical protein